MVSKQRVLSIHYISLFECQSMNLEAWKIKVDICVIQEMHPSILYCSNLKIPAWPTSIQNYDKVIHANTKLLLFCMQHGMGFPEYLLTTLSCYLLFILLLSFLPVSLDVTLLLFCLTYSKFLGYSMVPFHARPSQNVQWVDLDCLNQVD